MSPRQAALLEHLKENLEGEGNRMTDSTRSYRQRAGLSLVVALSVAMILGQGVSLAWSASARPDQQEEKKDDAKEKKEQELPLKTESKIEFTTDEGTWMSLDLSPDGKTILFDLLGDIYTLPIAGGEAKRIVGGLSFE